MTLNKQIKADKIEAREIFAALTTAMSNVVEVDITTLIDTDLDKVEPSTATQSFSTHINLLDGTVDHEIDLKLIDNSAYRELQRWHIEQVKQRQASLIKNLASLEEMRRIISPSSSMDD